MRHYSQISEHDIYVTCKGDVAFVRGFDSQEPIVAALARCLEIPLKDVQSYLFTGKPFRLTPAECRVLDEFLAFSKLVAEELDTPLEQGYAAVFYYVNLNDGKSVSWTYIS